MKQAVLCILISLGLASLACGASGPTPAPTFTPQPLTHTATLPAPTPAGPASWTPLPPTITASPTPTPNSLPTATPTTSPTFSPAPPTLTPGTAASHTPTPPTMTPSATTTPTPSPNNCTVLPAGNFVTIWQNNPAVQTALGCPTSNHPRITPDAWEVQTAYQSFEHGTMIWSDKIGWYEHKVVYVLYENGNYLSFDDTFDPAVDPTSGGETPPAGLVEPIFGFGKVWRQIPDVRASLGWGTAGELGGSGRFQLFEGGDMLWISQNNKTYVFDHNSSTFSQFDIPFQ